MILLPLAARELASILDFQSRASRAAELALGAGEAHVHVVEIDPGGEIGRHVAGFGQLFVCLEGSGWVAAADDARVSIGPGEAAYFARGEMHSKGSIGGLRALIIQVRDLELTGQE
jgi:quercetin dioxygenase-like cupin family protein